MRKKVIAGVLMCAMMVTGAQVSSFNKVNEKSAVQTKVTCEAKKTAKTKANKLSKKCKVYKLATANKKNIKKGKAMITYKLDINGDNKNETIQIIPRDVEKSRDFADISEVEIRVNNSIKARMIGDFIAPTLWAMTYNGKDVYLMLSDGISRDCMSFYQLRGKKIVNQGYIPYDCQPEKIKIDSKGLIPAKHIEFAIQCVSTKVNYRIDKKTGKILAPAKRKTDNFLERNYITLKKDLVVRTGAGTKYKKKTIKKGNKIQVLKATTTGKYLSYDAPHFVYIKTKNNVGGWIYLDKNGRMVDNKNAYQSDGKYFKDALIYG